MKRRPPTRQAAGYSLMELVFATALVAGTLAPAVALVRDGMELSRTTDQHMLLTNYGISLLEEHQALVAATWIAGAASGDFTGDGHADLRYEVTWSDLTIDGGVEGQLMHIRVTTYWDEDGDDALGANEKRCGFRTKIAKIASYESIATP